MSTPHTSTASPPVNASLTLPPTPPKPRRKPTLLIASVATIILGTLGAVTLYQATSSGHQVVAVRKQIDRGALIKAEDLMTVEITLDPALKAVDATQMAQLIGKRAATDMSAGGLVTPESITDKSIPARGKAVVGVAANPAQIPSESLRGGDKVKIVLLPDAAGAAAQSKDTQIRTVEGVVITFSTQNQTGTTLLNVLVDADQAPAVAAASGAGKTAVVLESQEK